MACNDACIGNCRIGYACINSVCASANKSCIEKTVKINGIEYAIDLANKNLDALLDILRWNVRNGITLFRMSSAMFPHLTNPAFIQSSTHFAYPIHQFDSKLSEIGRYARKHDLRLTFHPSQFNQVGTPNENVFAGTLRDLHAHAEILDRMGCDGESVMVVHGGGTYGDKNATLERWVSQFRMLPANVQERLVLENCERAYNYNDMLKLSKVISRPVVFDTHHHDCYSSLVKPLKNPELFLHRIIDTWRVHGLKPKFHVSEQDPHKRIGAHSILVETLPQYLFHCTDPIDVMIEAKGKEKAIFHLLRFYEKRAKL